MTEENKLTLADCMLYHKARIQEIFNDDLVIYDNILDRLVESDYPYWEDLSDCKLILRTIEQLTDEEKQYIIDKNFMHNIEVLFKYDINEIIRNTYSNKTIKLINYFREIGIDIDGMFASGKAVKE